MTAQNPDSANSPRKAKAPEPVQTTGQVAEILEAKYGILEAFAETYAPQIADAFAHSVAGALESVMMGTPINDPYAGYVFTLLKGLDKTYEKKFELANEYQKSFGVNIYTKRLNYKLKPKK